MLIPFQWIGLFATLTVFAVMFAIGLMLGREQIAAALQRRVVLAAVVFAVVVPVPVLAVLTLKAFALKGPVAVGIVLMAISPGAPVALRRALDAGGNREFAPALHQRHDLLAPEHQADREHDGEHRHRGEQPDPLKGDQHHGLTTAAQPERAASARRGVVDAGRSRVDHCG